MNQEEALAAQKEQCIFCKIIKGDIPAKKVYEDDKIIAILDINPARKGHLLVMPKEHYPILPLMPFDEMQHLFKKTQGLMQSLKDAVLSSHSSLFIANGAAAGQQSPHFLYHIIPRDENDMFVNFDIPTGASKEDNTALVMRIKDEFSATMNAYLAQTGRTHLKMMEEPPQLIPETRVNEPVAEVQPSTAPEEGQLDKLIDMINENDDLKEAIINRPEEVKEAARSKDKWKELFAGVDIDKLSENLKAMASANVKRQAHDDDNNDGADLDAISKVI